MNRTEKISFLKDLSEGRAKVEDLDTTEVDYSKLSNEDLVWLGDKLRDLGEDLSRWPIEDQERVSTMPIK